MVVDFCYNGWDYDLLIHDNSDTFSDQVYAAAATFMAVVATMILTVRTAVIFIASLAV